MSTSLSETPKPNARSSAYDTSHRPIQLGRALDLAAALLLLSGLAHTLIWLNSSNAAADWEGPLSWRKPILFGISGGLTAWSLARVVNRLASNAFDRILVPMTAVCLVIEVALITLQTWRGVPSHFNRATPLDTAIELAMLVLITQVVLATAAWTVRAFQRFDAEPATRLAYRAGLVLLLVASLLGYGVTLLGSHVQSNGGDPSTYGEAGVLKFAHGMPIHAIQLLPLVARVLRRVSNEPMAEWAVRITIAATAAATIYAIIQTGMGAPRFPPTSAATAGAAVAGTLTLALIGFSPRHRAS